MRPQIQQLFSRSIAVKRQLLRDNLASLEQAIEFVATGQRGKR